MDLEEGGLVKYLSWDHVFLHVSNNPWPHSPSSLTSSSHSQRFLTLSCMLQSFSSSSSSSSSSLPSLQKPKVVVTRQHGKNKTLTTALDRYGVPCLELPLIEHIKEPDRNHHSTVLSDTAFDWIVITSPEAASIFLDAWKAAGTPNVLTGVVGAGTERIFEEVKRLRGGSPKVAFLPSKASELPKCWNKTCTVLYPASAKAGNEIEEVLSDRGFVVTRLNTYSTVPVRDVNLTVLTQALSAPVIAIASPSAVLYGHSLINIRCFAILWSVHFCPSALIYFLDRFSLFSEHRFPVHLDVV